MNIQEKEALVEELPKSTIVEVFDRYIDYAKYEASFHDWLLEEDYDLWLKVKAANKKFDAIWMSNS